MASKGGQYNARPLTPPPSYESVMQERPSLSYEDFWPNALNGGSDVKIKKLTFEKFDSLVKRANEFLANREDIVIKNIESMEKKVVYVDDVYNGAMFYKSAESNAVYITGLRIWYLRQDDSARTRPQEINYVNLIPKRINPGKKYPEFESIYQTLTAFNEQLYRNPRGHILGISTVFLKVDKELWKIHDGNLNWDLCSWLDGYDRHAFYFLRIFHLAGPPVHEAIGVEDITPTCLEDQRIHDDDDYDDLWNCRRYSQFSSLIQEAQQWILTNGKNKRITNMQTLQAVCAETEQGGMFFSPLEPFHYQIDDSPRACFLRIAYVSAGDGSALAGQIPCLSYRTFVPGYIKGQEGFDNVKYQDMKSIMEHVTSWLNVTGANVLFAETVGPIQWAWIADSGLHGTEDTVNEESWDDGPHSSKLVYFIRIYLDGCYGEPPHSTCDNPRHYYNDDDDCIIL